MAVVLRLTRRGSKKRPFYRVVAAEKTMKRDGRYLEMVGMLNAKTDPPTLVLKEDKIKKWIGVGAKPSRLVRDLIVKTYPGFIEAREKHQHEKILARRKTRKTRKSKSPK